MSKDIMNPFKVYEAYKKDKELRESGKVYVHAVTSDEGPISCHTHNMENYGLRNITMKAPDNTYVDFCYKVLTDVSRSMIEGEKYSINANHAIDDGDTGKMIHAFRLVESKECDDNTGKPNLEIEYFFNERGLVPYNGGFYIFDHKNKKWIDIKGKVVDDE